jgi:hypothetical protein
MNRGLRLVLFYALLLAPLGLGGAPAADRVVEVGVVSPLAAQARDLGLVPAQFRMSVVVGLKLRHKAELDAWLADVSDPSSPNFQHFLTQPRQKPIGSRLGPSDPSRDLRLAKLYSAFRAAPA